MNLVAYDNVDTIVNKKRSWIDVRHKYLYTRETTYRKYVSFGKRFNADENKTVFFIILTDDEPIDRPSSKTVVTNNGCIKIGLKGIWDEAGLNKVTTQYLNVSLVNNTSADDGDVYEFCPAC